MIKKTTKYNDNLLKSNTEKSPLLNNNTNSNNSPKEKESKNPFGDETKCLGKTFWSHININVMLVGVQELLVVLTLKLDITFLNVRWKTDEAIYFLYVINVMEVWEVNIQLTNGVIKIL